MSHNILLLLDGMSAGGLERQIVELLKGMRDCPRFRMFLGVLMKGGERENEAKMYADVMLPIKQGSGYDLTLAWSLLRFIPEYQIHCIHSFGSVADLSAIFAGKMKNIPVINGSVRSAPPHLYGRHRISRWSMPFATWIVANSHAGLKAFGVDRLPNTSVIYNGMAMERFGAVEHMARRNGPELCMVANFTQKKDQEALVRAFPLLKSRYPGARLTLVGRGEKKKGELTEMIESLGLNGDIELATSSDHPEQYIQRSDVCILLTNPDVHGEGISNSIMEYMAMAKPVVATDCGGNGELIEDGRTGFLVSDHRPETIFHHVDTLLRDIEMAVRIGERGRERINRLFSLETMIDNYRKLYENVLARR